MDSYNEYPVRCSTCNEQIACFADTYEDLLSAGNSIEEALNALGIMRYCSRISMMSPTVVTFNMENRDVIEGIKDVEAVDFPDPRGGLTGNALFQSCVPTEKGQLYRAPPRVIAQPILPPQPQPRPTPSAQLVIPPPTARAPLANPVTIAQPLPPKVPANQNSPQLPAFEAGTPQLEVQRAHVPVPGVKAIVKLPRAPVQPIVPGPIPLPAVTAAPIPVITDHPDTAKPINVPAGGLTAGIQPLVQNIPLEEITAMGEGIAVNVQGFGEFKYPDTVGVPTINEDPAKQRQRVYVGAGKYTYVLNGRTCLAR